MTADLGAIRSLLDALGGPGRWPFTREQRAAAAELDTNAQKYLTELCDEVEALRAAVERVRALLRDPLDVSDFDTNRYVPMVKVSDIRHALRALDGAE